MREFRADKIPHPNVPPLPDSFQSEFLDLEIGAGQGLHAIRYCLGNPERHLIAIERTEVRFSAFRARQNRHSVPNLLAVRADAQGFIAHLIEPQSLQRVFLLYPNPYPKAKQANLRWHRSPFIGFLHSRIQTGGRLYLATNLKWYADEAEEYLNKEGLFQIIKRRELDIGDVPRTHFEKKYLERGETCFDLVFEKWVQ